MNQNLQEAHGGAANLGKTVFFPNVSDFGRLFVSAHPTHDYLKNRPFAHTWSVTGWNGGPNGVCHLSALALASGPRGARWGLEVVPCPFVIDAIGAHMLLRPDERIHFEIVLRERGVALIIAKYNQIIGDRWLAFVDSSTVPR